MYTKGTFKDGTKGWKIDNRITSGVKGFEIHWSDDGECVTDHVYIGPKIRSIKEIKK